jgi:hypothetical protein
MAISSVMRITSRRAGAVSRLAMIDRVDDRVHGRSVPAARTAGLQVPDWFWLA